jgi:cystathionine beta-lyase
MDNTWATPLYFRALDAGVDLVIHAGTKYFSGHADVSIGSVAANKDTVAGLKNFVGTNGLCVGPDDVYLALRGVRTLAVRLDRHYRSGLTVARWLEQRPEILRLLHPALPSDPGHDIWKRDFAGACGLFSTRLSYSESELPGAASKASLFRSIARIYARPHHGSPAVRRYACMSDWRPSKT